MDRTRAPRRTDPAANGAVCGTGSFLGSALGFCASGGTPAVQHTCTCTTRYVSTVSGPHLECRAREAGEILILVGVRAHA